MTERGRPVDPAYQPVALSPADLAILRAVVSRLLPQAAGLDLAARMDAQLAAGDGWRHESLPADAAAYALSLRGLDAAGFMTASAEGQDALLARAASGKLSGELVRDLDGAQMALWFEDCLATAARLFMAHPATLSRIRFSGIGCAGDGDNKPGFVQIGIGEREAWEP